MIYQVKDNKKIPLGTQFDNSWQIEYDRDLSSQLSGKSEWTATEDCWFQYSGIWLRKAGDNDISKAENIAIIVNGVAVQISDSSGANNIDTTVVSVTASVILKKGDVITISSDLGSTFGKKYVKVLPIHRILSKDDKYFVLPVTINSNKVNIDVSSLFHEILQPYQITFTIVTSTATSIFSIIAYKNWNNKIYYSTIINQTEPSIVGSGAIESVSNSSIVYQVVGNINETSEHYASVIKL